MSDRSADLHGEAWLVQCFYSGVLHCFVQQESWSNALSCLRDSSQYAEHFHVGKQGKHCSFIVHVNVQAARAPLLVAVLQGYRSICGEAWQAELRSVFPHLTHLICSAQPSVRTALADLLQAQIPKMIA